GTADQAYAQTATPASYALAPPRRPARPRRDLPGGDCAEHRRLRLAETASRPSRAVDFARLDAARARPQHRGLASKVFALALLGDCRRAEGDALAAERELDFLPRLVDPPLDGGERDLERVGDLGVREADDVAEQERHLQVDGQVLNRAPERVDLLEPLDRRVQYLERRDVVERDEGPRPAL